MTVYSHAQNIERWLPIRIAIVLKENLATGLLANAAACIASGLFHGEEGLLGEEIVGAECKFVPITKIPILVFRQNNKDFSELLKRAKRNKLKYVVFTREAQSTTSYEDYAKRVEGKMLGDLDVIGIGVLGEDDLIGRFAGDLSLMR